jgi:branched-chain amino acid aminotransferase
VDFDVSLEATPNDADEFRVLTKISRKRTSSLYIRINLIGTQATLKVAALDAALLYMIASPCTAPAAFMTKPLSIKTSVRGRNSEGTNSNSSMTVDIPQSLAANAAAPVTLWLVEDHDAETGRTQHLLSDMGTMMNIFVAITNDNGQKELVTPPLDGHILDGVMRDCILTLGRERLENEGWKVSERRISMQEVLRASDEGRLVEVFGSNTATITAPIANIEFETRTLDCEILTTQGDLSLAERMKAWITDIQFGELPDHPWR